MTKLNREMILSWFLAFVVIWFGASEITRPAGWVTFVPDFAKTIGPALELVSIHGFALIALGAALVFNFYRRTAAVLLALILLEIIFFMLQKGGLNPIVVRDIGLFGVALALSFRN